MPEETDNQGYSDNSLLKNKELLVKPLGISFEFRNIPSMVSRIEIVRAKRDINNKTILSQGVIQKIGTYHDSIGDSDHVPPTEGSIMPHPVIAMGYNYSCLGPVYEILETGYNSDDITVPWTSDNKCAFFGFPNAVVWERSGADTTQFIGYTDFGGGRNVRYDFTKHALSPYRASNTDFLFINPETSFYGVDYTEQIRNITTTPSLEIVDIIFPKSTPPTLLTDAGSGKRLSYYGSPLHERLSFYGGGKWNPSALYFGADINTKNRNNTTFFSAFGLFGLDMKNINPNFDHNLALDLCKVIPAPEKLDIYPPTLTDGVNNITYPRGYIATGGSYVTCTGDQQASYRNGADRVFSDAAAFDNGRPIQDIAPAYKTANIEGGLIGGTFKYFRRLFDVKNDAKSVRFLYQNSRNITNKTVESTGNPFGAAYTRTMFDVSSFEYSGDTLPKTKAGLITPDRYVSNGGKQYLNLSYSLTIGDCRDFNHDKSEIDDVYVSSVLAISGTKASGHHGEGIVLSVNNENTIPHLLSVDTVRNEYSNSNYTAEHKVFDKMGMATLSTYVMNMKKMNLEIP